MKCFSVPRENDGKASHSTLDHTHHVQKKRVFVGLEGGFVHQSADGRRRG
jgi:hypothetical protein